MDDAESNPNFRALELDADSNGLYKVLEVGEQKIVFDTNDEQSRKLKLTPWLGATPGSV